jgi:hypothetical protein
VVDFSSRITGWRSVGKQGGWFVAGGLGKLASSGTWGKHMAGHEAALLARLSGRGMSRQNSAAVGECTS